jgi:predicted DNA-binding transcriptional regulator YafY
MRADRLLSLLMLLQARGRMTAAELARELEVSVRTVYRDIEALSVAGVPVYAESGPGGGCALVDGYRTTLTGLTADEARALFMLSIPAPLAQLGVADELKSALLKLAAALPAARRGEEERARNRVHVDAVDWSAGGEAVPHLRVLYRAAWEDRRIHLTYRTFLGIEVTQTVEPLGLIAKAGIWHLVYVYGGQVRVQRVSDIQNARVADERFVRPPDFDLAAFWQAACAEREANRLPFLATVRLAPVLLPHLPRYFGELAGDILAQAASADAEGWLTATLPFESFEAAREGILGFGSAAEVLAPEALRCSVADFATQILSRYRR